MDYSWVWSLSCTACVIVFNCSCPGDLGWKKEFLIRGSIIGMMAFMYLLGRSHA